MYCYVIIFRASTCWTKFCEHLGVWFRPEFKKRMMLRSQDFNMYLQTNRQIDRQTDRQTDRQMDALSSPLSWLQFGRMRPSCDATISWHCAESSSSSTWFTSNQQVWFTLLESDVFTSVMWTWNSTKFLLNCSGWTIRSNTREFLHLEGESYM